LYYYGLFLIAMNGILAILGVVLGIIGMDRGWGYKAWIPLGIFSLIITVLIVLESQNNPYIIIYCILISIPQVLGVVPGIIGMDRGWGYKAWIPLGIFSLIITVLIVLAVYNGIWGAMRNAIVWIMIVIAELLGVVLGIIGINRGWGRKAWIPLGVALPTVMGSGIIILIITCCTT
jgi:hypothetical protein